jgi:tyrosyl-tRNA synthetase
MSSSYGNYIGLTESPEEQFGKSMRISDDALPEYYRLVMESDAPPAGDPMDAKLRLARFIVARSHGDEASARAEAHFTRVVREGRSPDDIPEVILPVGETVHLPALLAASLGVGSTSEARRLLAQGGVKLDGQVLYDLDVPRAALAGKVLQAGKRKFARLTS